jgi:hypothetical protein
MIVQIWSREWAKLYTRFAAFGLSGWTICISVPFTRIFHSFSETILTDFAEGKGKRMKKGNKNEKFIYLSENLQNYGLIGQVHYSVLALK